MNSLIDDFTGTLNSELLSKDHYQDNTIIIKRPDDYHTRSSKDDEYIVVKFKGFISKDMNNIDGPKRYEVQMPDGTPRIITGLNLHPMYREVRNFKGLKNMLDDKDINILTRSYMELVGQIPRIFFNRLDMVIDPNLTIRKRYRSLNRSNLLDLCKDLQYRTDVIPRYSTYAEIMNIDNMWYIIDNLGRGYALVELIGSNLPKNTIVRGYLNYMYIDSVSGKNISSSMLYVYNLDAVKTAERRSVFYQIDRYLSHETRNLLKNVLLIKDLNTQLIPIAKSIQNIYRTSGRNIINYDIVVSSNDMSYHLYKTSIRKVILKVLNVVSDSKKKDSGYKYKLGYSDGTSLFDTESYVYYDDSVKSVFYFKVGSYVECKINCINGDVKPYTFINLKQATSQQYEDQVDLK
jgi:hypothetical protein